NRRLARHLRNHHDELFTFLDVPLLAPTNNLAEQEIRPAVVIRKISAGNRTDPGAHVHEVLASLSRTAERNDLRLPDLLPSLLRSTDADFVLPVLPTWAATPALAAGAKPRESDHGRPVPSSCLVRSAGRDVRRGRRAALPHPREHARAPPA
ncbi:MAG: IS66 family transposase, partial [Bryobacteraceae bacterium]